MSVANKAICTWGGMGSVALYTRVYTAWQRRYKHLGVCICAQVRTLLHITALQLFTASSLPPCPLLPKNKYCSACMVARYFMNPNLTPTLQPFRHVAFNLHHKVTCNHACNTVFVFCGAGGGGGGGGWGVGEGTGCE